MIFIGSSEVSIEGIGFVYKGSTLLWPTPHGELPDIHILPTSVDTVWRGLKEDYDSISSKSDNVLYLIEEEEKASGQKQINFIDYDGTIVASYTAEEWSTVTTLPANPSHDGLTAQGWNWTKAQIDTRLTDAPDAIVYVGQMYVTESGDTEIDISLSEGRTAPYLGCAVDGTISIDWGDGSTASTVTGTSLETQIRTQHTYAAAGEYTIAIHVESGSMALVGTSAYTLLSNNSSTLSNNYVYSRRVVGIRIGNNTSIGDYALHRCWSLEFVTIPKSVTSIGLRSINLCYVLPSVTIPNSVTSIGNYACAGCYSLTSITIPESVTSIGDYFIYQCYSLTSVTFPNSVTSFGNGPVYNCYALTHATLPKTITSISSNMFNGCSSLTSITIPDSVASIGNTAFRDCRSLTSITIPDSVTSIGQEAFIYCYSIESIAIPDSVTSIGSSAFATCYALKSVTIPESVTTIAGGMFSACSSLTSITIPDSVTSIEANAFYDCHSLTSITLPENITIINSYTFYDCDSLTSIMIPDSVTTIAGYSFEYCYSLTSITIPESVTSIGNYAFANCSGMAEYHFLSTTPPTLGGTSVFSSIPSDCKIYVPSASVDAYKAASRWSTHASKIYGE